MRQEYQTQPMFPIRCWSFKAPSGMNNAVLEAAQKLEYRNYNAEYGVGTSSSILKHRDFFDLHQWFQFCIDTLHIDNGWNCDRIVINKSWVNRSDAGSGHHHAPHRHPMSFLSGIYYMTEGPSTEFRDPLAQREWAQLHLDGAPITDSTQFVRPIPGGLFVFPSYMIHASDPNPLDFGAPSDDADSDASDVDPAASDADNPIWGAGRVPLCGLNNCAGRTLVRICIENVSCKLHFR